MSYVLCIYGYSRIRQVYFQLTSSLNVCVVNAGKYPQLMVACEGVTINSSHFELVVNYGSVPVGVTAEKFIEITNLSPVCNLLLTNFY